jgi:hypothetical protein
MKDHATIKEVRAVRRKISAEHGHDPARLVAHYQLLQAELGEVAPDKVLKCRRVAGKTMGASVTLSREKIARAVRTDRDAR